MSLINPLASAVAAQPLAQRTAADEKVRQARRDQTLSKNIAAETDRLEHEVESGDAVRPTDPNGGQPDARRRKRRRQPRDGGAPDEDPERPHIDLKA